MTGEKRLFGEMRTIRNFVFTQQQTLQTISSIRLCTTVFYRLSVAFQNTAYNQCTQTGFYIGPEMDKPPVPNNEYVRGINIPEFTEDIDEI